MALSLVVLATGCHPVPDYRRTEPPVVRTPEQIALDTACPITPSPYLADAKARGSLTVVGIGSSSMEGIGASAPKYNFVSRLDAALKAALPGVTVRIINAGIGGQNLPQMIARFEKDVYANKPSLVILQAGMNDALQGRNADQYRKELQGALNDLKAHAVNVAMMSNQSAGKTGVTTNPSVVQLDLVNKEEAASRGIPVIDRYTLFKSLQDQGVNVASTYYIPDALHANDEGYRLITTCTLRKVFGLK
ncbi:SGNH/GDSL hydrolase family protein [Deinococcus sp. 23YEL01]|nr:SGNH/GDSL hydrolase family protein [Deinococcus sp. 23YEL01]